MMMVYYERRRYQWDVRIRRGDESLKSLAALEKECTIEDANICEEAKAKVYLLLQRAGVVGGLLASSCSDGQSAQSIELETILTKQNAAISQTQKQMHDSARLAA